MFIRLVYLGQVFGFLGLLTMMNSVYSATPTAEEMWEIIQQQQQMIEQLKQKLEMTEEKVEQTEQKVVVTEQKVEETQQEIEAASEASGIAPVWVVMVNCTTTVEMVMMK